MGAGDFNYGIFEGAELADMTYLELKSGFSYLNANLKHAIKL